MPAVSHRLWNDWPFDHINVNVVGWAAYDRDLLQWSDDSVDIYINDIREDADAGRAALENGPGTGGGHGVEHFGP